MVHGEKSNRSRPSSKMKKVSKEIQKQKLLEKIPKLTFNEVRRLRLPLHEALTAELKEGNFENGLKLFTDFVQHDLQNSKALVRDSEFLERIFEVLKVAEYSLKEDEVELFLKFAHGIKNLKLFHWLVEKILMHAMLLVSQYELGGTRVDAISQYLYGKFLAKHHGMLKHGLLSLEKAFEMTLEHIEWQFEVQPGVEVQVYKLSATKFCDVSIKLSQSLTIKEPEAAMELAYVALRVIRENPGAVESHLEVDAEFEFASCFKEKNEVTKALHHLDHALELSNFIKLHQKSFKILVKMSECFEDLKNDEKYEETLTAAKDLAKVHLDPTVQGDVLVKLAQYYVKRENFEKASDFFTKAKENFHESGERKKFRKVELMQASLIAQKYFNNVVDTILKSDKAVPGYNNHIENLILWVDRQEPLSDVTETDVDEFIKNFYDPDEQIRLDLDL